VARSPGRVNLIGEHIDYSLYEVLPMAVTADLILAVGTTPLKDGEKPVIKLANTNAKFQAREFGLTEDGSDVEINAEEHEWSNYFKAALRGVLIALKSKGFLSEAGKISLDIVVDGTVPSGSGLSSSSAFVCASALALLTAYLPAGHSIDKTELTLLAIVAERAVGVNGGGMDQSASVFSNKGSATYVSFVPNLMATPVAFPSSNPELTFLIGQTFVAADKHVTGPVCYNLRVVECTLAAAILGKIFGVGDLPKDSSPLGQSLRSFHDAFFEKKEGVKSNHAVSPQEFLKQLEALQQMVTDYLPQEEGYTREQISDILDVSVPELEERYMTKFPVRGEKFLLQQRASHVFGEAARVLRFRELLSNPPTPKSDASAGAAAADDGLLKALGALMNETQDSCRDVYDCSCPELDELCALARGAGAYGSRLTGAGWGGCSVHLVPKDKVEAVTETWEEKYYKKKWPDITKERLDEAIVVSKPGSGSYVYKVVEGEFN
jgi:galactokinase